MHLVHEPQEIYGAAMAESTVYEGDACAVLDQLPAQGVRCYVMSSPYWGLRDYGTATWDGGDPACTHQWPPPTAHDQAMSTLTGFAPNTNHALEGYRCYCRRCGALQHDQGLGQEATLDSLGWATGTACNACYVCRMVVVFREVKGILRDDGTCWINLGEVFTSSSIRADVRYCLQSSIKGQPLIFGDAMTIGITSQSSEIPLYDNRFPYGILFSLFGIERITIKQRENHFCQVFHTFASPSYCWIGVPIAGMSRDATDLEIIVDMQDSVRIIISHHQPDSHSEFGILGPTSTGTRKERNRAFPIEEAAKPIAEIIRDGETIGDAIAFQTPLKCFPDIYLVNHPITLRDRFDPCSSEGTNFRITQASEQQFSFTLGNSGVDVTTTMVGHLYSLNRFGSFVHYLELYKRAIQRARTLHPKQELGISDLVKRALMADGWYWVAPH